MLENMSDGVIMTDTSGEVCLINAAARRMLDPVGHYNRPDVFRLHVDTSPRPPVVVESF